MLLVKNRVAPSNIQGVGVICLEEVKEGAPVLVDEPSIELTFYQHQLNKLPKSLAFFLRTHSWQNSPDYPDRVVVTIDAEKYINHSEQPNISDDGYACKDIHIGDELLIDYSGFCPNFSTMVKSWKPENNYLFRLKDCVKAQAD